MAKISVTNMEDNETDSKADIIVDRLKELTIDYRDNKGYGKSKTLGIDGIRTSGSRDETHQGSQVTQSNFHQTQTSF